MSGNIMGPILFFVLWNVIRLAFEWYTQEFGYKLGTSITKDLGGGLMGKITEGASILGMFVIGGLVQRWVSISFAPTVSTVTQSEGAYIDWNAIEAHGRVLGCCSGQSHDRPCSNLRPRSAPPASRSRRSPRSSRTSTSSSPASPPWA